MAYTDLTEFFEHNLRIDWQEFDELAENDAFIYLPSGTTMLFVQASAPTGWTKSTVQNDKALRVVSGSGGSSGGGVTGLSSTISIAHTHVVDAHTHTISNHLHVLDYTTQGSVGLAGPSAWSSNSDGALVETYNGVGGGADRLPLHNQTKTDGGGTMSVASTDAISSDLSDFVFKYFDAIICVKD